VTRRSISRALIGACSLLFLTAAGCKVGPNYHRPSVDVPTAYRAPELTPATNAGPSIGDSKWWTVFQDEQLQELIRIALQQNYDVRIAATRVLESQAQLGITHANQLPTLNVGGSFTSAQQEQLAIFPTYSSNLGEVTASASWELDFWGKFRRATEAARANLLASEWGQRATIDTLISNLATDYFQLRALDLELEISKRTLASRKESLRLTNTLADHGSAALLDVRQAEQLVYTAAANIPDEERQIQQTENAISVLLGRNPATVIRGRSIEDQPHPPTVPAGLPSELLARRPDIQQAEQSLIVANAQIGVAKAAFYPSITLTGTAGYASNALNSLFTGPAGLWSYGPQISQPIFSGGRLRSNLKLAEAQRQEMLLSYKQTIQRAFSDVSNALIAYQKFREFREQEENLAASAKDAARISHLRYEGGTSSYLEVLTNETNYYAAELSLAQARQEEITSLVQLYNALGGGWQQ
jgi:outer membrane protein, multidrug efflux system